MGDKGPRGIFLAGPELCHPSDNTGAVLGACEHAGLNGAEAGQHRLYLVSNR